MGCTNLENKINEDKEPISGGVAVGISPKVIYADRGENITFNIDLQSTENVKDIVTVFLNGSIINKTIIQEIKARENMSLPINIWIPLNAVNASFKARVDSQNLNSNASATGIILIKDKR
ncbi:MAG: hypothetical protein KKA10_14965 [Euryarchaeota archaeon]|nr:hypothetical protein [Euryarchaeota archaeon]MCG2737848.1 hypothetical protein [Candidatus Methanoperedenaceae archaeon]